MSKEKFAFDKTNFILLGIGMAVVIIGFLLMTGPVSTPTTFEPEGLSGSSVTTFFLIIFQTQITQMTRISNIPICVICVIHV